VTPSAAVVGGGCGLAGCTAKLWAEQVTKPGGPCCRIRSFDASGNLLFIEVMGRVAGATSVTISRSEILFGLNSPDNHVLALVSVGDAGAEDGGDGGGADDGDGGDGSRHHDEVCYIRRAFEGLDRSVHFSETGRNFNRAKMWSQGNEPS